MRKIEKKSEQVEVNGKVFTINEINPELVIDMLEGKAGFDPTNIKDMLAAACDITLDDIREHKITLGQMSEMFQVFKEVNSAFFTLLPLDSLLAGYQEVIANSISQELSKLPACSLPADTPAAGITAGDISATA